MTSDELLTEYMLSCAEKIAGLEFSKKERKQKLRCINKFRSNYIQLRKTEMVHRLTPPLYFNPQLPSGRYSQK
jgi:hypothetical protein